MKFFNIKVGDVVLTPEYISIGFNSRKSFLTAKKVINTTKTQFTTEDGKRWDKKKGKRIGGSTLFEKYDYAEIPTDLTEPLKPGTYRFAHIDQSKELEAAKVALKLRSEIAEKLEAMNNEFRTVKIATIRSLSELNQALTKAQDLLNTLPKNR